MLPSRVENPEDVRPVFDEVAYHFDDPLFGQKFAVMKGQANAFWMDDGTKLRQLLNRFKVGDTVSQACYTVGISYHQFHYFRLLHPWVYHVMRVYRDTISQRLKGVVLQAALGGQDVTCEVCHGKGFHGKTKMPESQCVICKGTGLVKTPPNAKMALGALHIPTLQDREDETEMMPPMTMKPEDNSQPEVVASELVQAFSDGNGHITISKQTIARLRAREQHGNENAGQ